MSTHFGRGSGVASSPECDPKFRSQLSLCSLSHRIQYTFAQSPHQGSSIFPFSNSSSSSRALEEGSTTNCDDCGGGDDDGASSVGIPIIIGSGRLLCPLFVESLALSEAQNHRLHQLMMMLMAMRRRGRMLVDLRRTGRRSNKFGQREEALRVRRWRRTATMV